MEPYHLMDDSRFYLGDCVEVMRSLPSNFVDLTVTSPPYGGVIRKYKGFDWDFKNTVAELLRVTKEGGVVVWVVNDTVINRSESGDSFRQALHFMEAGFKLHDTMIYMSSKPPLNHKRYEQAFEYMFVFSKGVPKTFNGIREPAIHAGKTIKRTFRSNSTASEMEPEYSINVVAPTKLKSNVWEYTTGYMSTKDREAFQHPAIFPEKLAEDHIITWSNEGDLVMDIFSGSGTTAKMSLLNNRKFVVSDISEDYLKLAIGRVEKYFTKSENKA